jgi:hypothetical protein
MKPIVKDTEYKATYNNSLFCLCFLSMDRIRINSRISCCCCCQGSFPIDCNRLHHLGDLQSRLQSV